MEACMVIVDRRAGVAGCGSMILKVCLNAAPGGQSDHMKNRKGNQTNGTNSGNQQVDQNIQKADSG